MAVIDRKNLDPKKNASVSLTSLTLAAMALPGLVMKTHAAENPESMSLLYQHYQEGARSIDGMDSKFSPVEVDSLLAEINFSLNDDWSGSVKVQQDTWSGATPVATAPVSAHGNRIVTSHAMTGASLDGYHGGHQHGGGGEDDEGTTNTPVTQTGASPYLYSSLKLDTQKHPLNMDVDGNLTGGVDKKLMHTLSSASPEVRQQFDANFAYAYENGKREFGGGISQERDFDSYFVHAAQSWDLNRKLSTLSVGLSYAYNKTHALLDHDAVPHVYEPYMFIYEKRGNSAYNDSHGSSQMVLGELAPTLNGTRDDWGLNLGISQIINRGAVLDASLSYTHSNGYQSNPYKAVEVAFIDPLKQKGQAGGNAAANYVYDAEVVGVLEERPDLREQATLGLRYTQYIAATDAALHAGYSYFQDSWGIRAHTLSLDWVQPFGRWTLTPSLRYYTQGRADFYVPYLITYQGLYTPVAGSKDTLPFDRNKLPAHYSSDSRLSAYGTLTEGLMLSRQLQNGASLDVSLEYRQHEGRLKLGGGGEASYADYNAYSVSLGLNFPLGGEPKPMANMDMSGMENMEGHHHHDMHSAHPPAAPAGVEFDHLLNAGDFMLGYRVMNSSQGGDIERDSKAIDDYTLINKACEGKPCYMRPTAMAMRMQMLDFMYAPTDWLTLMLMPQFVDMSMSMRLLEGSPRIGGMDDIGMAISHAEHEHISSGVGDTELHALVKLAAFAQGEVHLGLGLSAPTGKTDLKMRPMMGNPTALMDYGMQLGSGTWDFKTSLTYTGAAGNIGWGAQVSGTVRLQDKNDSGYALGDVVQSTAWTSYAFSDAIAVSLRGLYTNQDSIKGSYAGTQVRISPADYTSNYGGQFADVGVGLNGGFKTGTLAGTRWGIEWLQPVSDKPEGYQLQRKGSLVFNWAVHL